jgi:Pyruvate/2-oxoacid:ferredoxin oxidoreductase delta subunit
LLTSPELLLIFSLAVGKPYGLNLLQCGECPNAPMLPYLKDAVAHVAEITDHVYLVENEQGLDFNESGVSRREFFSLLRGKAEAAVCSLADQLQELPARPYGDKSLPSRRLLLMQLLKRLPDNERIELGARLFPRVEISAAGCSDCTGCVGICPSGALLPTRVDGGPPAVHVQNCTDCGLCGAFCGQGAIAVTPGWLSRVAGAVRG